LGSEYGANQCSPLAKKRHGYFRRDEHSLALQANGAVTAWGSNDAGQTDAPAGLTNAVAIAAGPPGF
jgi:hypothetical protein